MSEVAAPWDGARVRALRSRLGLTQAGLAAALGVRQQTVSEWETGQYRPRGASVRLLELAEAGPSTDGAAASSPARRYPGRSAAGRLPSKGRA